MQKRSKTSVNFQAPLDQNLDETSKQNGFRDHTGGSCKITHPPGKYSLDLQVNKERINKLVVVCELSTVPTLLRGGGPLSM